MSIVAAMPGRADTRVARGAKTRIEIVDSCRVLMMAGNFRPPLKQIVWEICGVQNALAHFGTLDKIYEAALDDVCAVDAIVCKLIGEPAIAGLSQHECQAIAHAAVFGRVLS